MKTRLFLLSLLGVIMVGCSSEGPVKSNDDLPEGYTKSYLSISVIGASSAGTRASGEEYKDEENNEMYEDGTDEENKINEVRFFFFEENDEAAMIRKESTGYFSWIDMQISSGDQPNHDETVEKIVETTFRLNIPEGRKNPGKVLVVINPTADIRALQNPSLGTLKQTIRNFKKDDTEELTKNNFVMSNTVYADDEGNVYDAEILTADNFQTSDKAAKEHPVQIYVERVLARVDFSLEDLGNEAKTLEDGTNIYNIFKLRVPDGDEKDRYYINGDDEEGSDYKDIYVKFLGWNITGTPTKSRLIKAVNGAWTDIGLFGNASSRWTTTDYHRSFWALNPDLNETPTLADYTSNPNYEFVSFNNVSLSVPSGKTYLQENANKYSAEKTAAAPGLATKVFIAAQLVDENGKYLNLVKWLNGYYTVKGAKIAMANALDIYKYKQGTDNVFSYVKIEPSDLNFDKAESEEHGYYAKATVDTETTWYKQVVNETTGAIEYKKINEVESVDVNSYIYTKLGYALVWNTKGYTYYYFDIRHLGDNGSVGYNGIVRNHIYRTSVTSIAGLGTPVYDPDETQDIYPEVPEKECIISAKVNILSWRVVASSYDLVW